MKAIQGLIHEIDNERRRNETNLNNLNRIQEKYGTDEKSNSNSYQHKLRNLLKTCMNDATQEENKIRQALTKITEIRNIRNERRIQVKIFLFKIITNKQNINNFVLFLLGKKCWKQRNNSSRSVNENVTNVSTNITSVC